MEWLTLILDLLFVVIKWIFLLILFLFVMGFLVAAVLCEFTARDERKIFGEREIGWLLFRFIAVFFVIVAGAIAFVMYLII